jgi:hypothetical protein
MRASHARRYLLRGAANSGTSAQGIVPQIAARLRLGPSSVPLPLQSNCHYTAPTNAPALSRRGHSGEYRLGAFPTATWACIHNLGSALCSREAERGLVAPYALCVDARGNLWISDQGTSMQVKVFDPAGKLLQTIGKAAGPPTVAGSGPDSLRSSGPSSSRRRWWALPSALASRPAGQEPGTKRSSEAS